MDIQDTVLMVIDVQGKLASLMHGHERLFTNIERAIKIAQILEIPILWTEQAPEKIGTTVEPISQLLFPVVKPISKRSFSCWGSPEFVETMRSLRRARVLVTGIETHVCVYQTVGDLKRHGYQVHVLADAVSSRSEANKTIALERMRGQGVVMSSVEMAMCELLKTADHPKFRDVMANIKRQVEQ